MRIPFMALIQDVYLNILILAKVNILTLLESAESSDLNGTSSTKCCHSKSDPTPSSLQCTVTLPELYSKSDMLLWSWQLWLQRLESIPPDSPFSADSSSTSVITLYQLISVLTELLSMYSKDLHWVWVGSKLRDIDTRALSGILQRP